MIILSILGIGICVVLGLLILVSLVILFTPCKISIEYPNIVVYVSWNGIKYQIYPYKENQFSFFTRLFRGKKTEKQGGKPFGEVATTSPKAEELPEIKEDTKEDTKKQEWVEKKAENKGKKAKKPKKAFKKPDIDFEKIMKIIEISLEATKKILKDVVFERLYVSLVIADCDKAKVALTYGYACGVISNLSVWAENNLKIKDQRVSIGADFEKEKTEIAFHIIVYMRPITAITAALAAFIRIKKEGVL